MSRDNDKGQKFDKFGKEQLADVLCQADKEQVLASLRKAHKDTHRPSWQRTNSRSIVPQTQLQDCTFSPGFSYNHL
jgi:hypothetical protein